MTEKLLFEALPEQPAPERSVGKARLLEPMRDQVEVRSMDIDSLIGEDHPARLIWAYVEQLDLRELEDAIKAREGTPGHPAITPRLLLALWLYATSQGVGSARALARLCESHDAYRWLLGGVSVNYHTLSDFRVGQCDLVDRLLKENAWNVQVVTVAGTSIVVAVKPSTVGSDRGLLRPMLERIRKRFNRLPQCHLADGGFAAGDDIEWAHHDGVAVYCPPTQSKHGGDPCQPKRGDGPGVLAWRSRMASTEGKAQYQKRAICECIHARWRNWNLVRLNVRGEAKVTAVMLWHALANNILQADRMLRGHRITTA